MSVSQTSILQTVSTQGTFVGDGLHKTVAHGLGRVPKAVIIFSEDQANGGMGYIVSSLQVSHTHPAATGAEVSVAHDHVTVLDATNFYTGETLSVNGLTYYWVAF